MTALMKYLPTFLCRKCSFKHAIFYILSLYLLFIFVWTLFAHFTDYLVMNGQSTKLLPKTSLSISSIAVNNDINHSNKNDIHIMYSVGCGSLFMWQLQQAIVLDWSWITVHQTGHLTRLVSGCNQSPNAMKWMSTTNLPLDIGITIDIINDTQLIHQCLNGNMKDSIDIHWNSDQKRFHIIFLPSFDEIKSDFPFFFGSSLQTKDYPQLNRLLALHFIFHCNSNWKNIPQTFIAMIDPDFIFLQALNLSQLQLHHGLREGFPISGKYGLSSKWIPWLKEYYSSNAMSNEILSNLNGKISNKYFESGVPYILHKNDWFRLIPKWISFISFAYSKYNGIESDMYAYIMASVVLQLRHNLIENMMSTCMKRNKQSIHPFNKDLDFFIHYCTLYCIDIQYLDNSMLFYNVTQMQYCYNKHWTKARKKQLWMIECQSPILIEPPIIPQLQIQSNKAYMILHELVPRFNIALIEYKNKYCEKSERNVKKQIVLHEATLFNGNVLFNIIKKI